MDSEPNIADPYEAVLADLRAKREQIDQAIATIEAVRGAPARPIDFSRDVQHHGSARQSANVRLGPGAFLGMTIPDAAKKLLAHERRQMSNAEILAAIRTGGLVMNSTDPLNTVGSVLTRRFKDVGDIVRVARGTWGLKEWYPNRTFKPVAKGTGESEPEAEGAVASELDDEIPF